MTQRFSRRESATNCGGAGWVIVRLIGVDPDDKHRPVYEVTIADRHGKSLFQKVPWPGGASTVPDTASELKELLDLLGTAAWEYELWMRSRPEDRGPSLVLFDEATSQWAFEARELIKTAAQDVQEHIDLGRGIDD